MHGKKVILGALFLSGVLTVGGTAAYMTTTVQRVNKVAVGQNTTVIEENFPDPPALLVTENPEYEKKVWVTNRTSAEDGYNVNCYVRVALSYSNSDIGKAVILKNLNTTDWVYGSDGYYYYTKILNEGKTTPALFTGFSIQSDKVQNAYKEYIQDFSISVYEESVQAGDFKNYQDAWAFYLNPVGTV